MRLLAPSALGHITYLETPEWAAILSFTQVFVLWSLNTIATSIENPFGRDANDIDGTLMQCEFNEWLRMCLLPHVDRSPSLSEDFEVEGKELGMADILTCRKSRGLHTILRDTMTQLQEHLEADMHQDDSLSSTSDRGSEAQSELKLQLAVSALAAASAVMEEGVPPNRTGDGLLAEESPEALRPSMTPDFPLDPQG
eukprot:CAMPEP_0206540222 /NCGR_PEP_ID=MMETSP0325_2-20121206/8863_1 /ASSEMBLY_ACC=CAM_ASM_000347 /TAXON_ID=2866 /ORGANISM="Crypthecodinium cohnii, Strain Seligo" /LENGTH=196 /DNA_ID=CAMNT_0054037877 /DNA_START=186 /DNA_END=777 /DNA_ORIENTATION=+